MVRYLLGTIDHSIVYRTSTTEPFELQAYVDADWAGCKLTRRSQSGGVVFAAGGPIMWFSSKQPLVTLSSAEAELTALTNIVKDVLWLRRVVTDIGLPPNGPTDIYCDNQAAIQIAYESSVKRKTKHTQIYYHFVKDELDDKSIAVNHVCTTYNKADILTKNMIAGIFLRLRDYLLIAVADC